MMILAQGLIEDRTRKQGCQGPVQPDEKGDDGADGAIDEGIIAHVVDVIGENDGKHHPGCRGKDRAGQNKPPAGTNIGRKGIDCRGQRHQADAHGQETDFIPEGNEFSCDRKELGHEIQHPFPDKKQENHHRNEDQDDDIKEENPL